MPTWNTRKGFAENTYERSRYKDQYRLRFLRFPGWYYRVRMADNARERSPWSDAVAAEVRAERARMDWTQLEMVKRSGVKRSTYMRIESGVHVADASELARICGAVGISLSEFFYRVEQRHPEP